MSEIKTLTFYSNYFNHHQKALCDEFHKLLGDGFKFVETMPMEGFRSKMGWGEDTPSYVIKTYESEEMASSAEVLAVSSDLVIMGTAPEEYCEARLKENKLTFRYSERPLKEGFIKFFIPRLTKKYIRMHLKNRNKNIYVLGASAFTALDFKKMFNSYPDKCYKFGYFPVHMEYDIDALMERKKEYAKTMANLNGGARLSADKNCPSILWMGRMLKLKHPELVVLAARQLKDLGYNFTLHMVGEGEMRSKVEKLTCDLDLSDRVTFQDFLSPTEARECMAKYQVYVMTSDKLEGWGSVIYEGLNAGCSVVASHVCGATPWLVEDEKCGLVFKSCDVGSLTSRLKKLLDNPELIDEYGKNAYEKMHSLWNPENAAKSVIRLADGLIAAGADGDKIKYPANDYVINEGPCSKAGYLKNNWFCPSNNEGQNLENTSRSNNEMYKLDFSKPQRVHFMGIGGISMSGLAEILADRGFSVSGSDRAPSKITELLEKKGIKVMYGQVKENITDDIELLVYTAAISADNEELLAAKEKGITCIPRADMLGQIMKNYEVPIAISGTHGKTTTTSMITTVLMEAMLDPTVTVGGMLDCIGGNLRIGQSDVFVTEACEYTNSFLSFFPKISIILNVEEDHMDFFKDIEDIRNSFRRFAELLPEDGLLVISADIDNYEEITKNVKCKVVTFGNNENADYKAASLSYDEKGCGQFNIVRNGQEGEAIELSVPGSHNVTNALASVAVFDFLKVDEESVVSGLKAFHGADRRFQHKGEVNGITVIDDYAHHPTEIRATLNAARNYKDKKITVVFQPHTYTRTKAFFDDFVDALMIADQIILAEIYAAREKNTIGISSKDLEEALIKKGADAKYFEKFEEIEEYILKNCQPGELLITMGAGNVDIIGDNILKK